MQIETEVASKLACRNVVHLPCRAKCANVPCQFNHRVPSALLPTTQISLCHLTRTHIIHLHKQHIAITHTLIPSTQVSCSHLTHTLIIPSTLTSHSHLTHTLIYPNIIPSALTSLTPCVHTSMFPHVAPCTQTSLPYLPRHYPLYLHCLTSSGQIFIKVFIQCKILSRDTIQNMHTF